MARRSRERAGTRPSLADGCGGNLPPGHETFATGRRPRVESAAERERPTEPGRTAMTNLTTQHHYDVPGGTLKVVLTTDHVLTPVERAELDGIAAACAAFQAHERSGHLGAEVAAAFAPALEVDEAIW